MGILAPILLAALSAPPLPVAPPPRLASTAEVDTHLAAWKKATAARTSLRTTITLTRADLVFHNERRFSGVFLWMRPNYYVLRMNYDSDKTGTDYEAFVCDGQSVFAYNGIAKKVTEYRNSPTVPEPERVGPPTEEEQVKGRFAKWYWFACHPTEQLPYQCLIRGGQFADQGRFQVRLHKTDKHYVYLDIEPLLAADRAEFQKARIALSAPDAEIPYWPVLVWIVRANGDTEMWKFTEPQIDLTGLDKRSFQYQAVPGFTADFTPEKASRSHKPILPPPPRLP